MLTNLSRRADPTSPFHASGGTGCERSEVFESGPAGARRPPPQDKSAEPRANFRPIDKTTELALGIHVISLVSDKAGTLELRELSLALATPQGVVLVVGCSHPGIDRIVEAATKIDSRVHLIAGGLHLVVSQDEDIAKIVDTLHNTYKVAYVAPDHCTGEPSFEALSKAFAERYL